MVYVPHGRSLSMRFMKGNSISAWIPFHLQLFTKKSLRRLLEDAGFNQQISPVPSSGATGQAQITRVNSIRIYEYNPTSWLPLSIMQWRNQRQSTAKYNPPRWFTLACYPIGWLATKFGMGEELVGIGRL